MGIEIRRIVDGEEWKVHDLLVSDYYCDSEPIADFHLDGGNINVLFFHKEPLAFRN